MDNKKILACFLIFILLMLLFRSSRNNTSTSTSTSTTTKVVTTRPYYHQRVRDPNYHRGVNPYKAQYYN